VGYRRQVCRAAAGLAAFLAVVLLSSGAADALPPSAAGAAPSAEAIRTRIAELKTRLDSLAADGCYLVIDTVHNRLQLRRGQGILREATCATGSGSVLIGQRGRAWRFTTPVRRFRVTRKVTDPIWKKPEWAFVETGEQAPVLPWAFSRLDGATLGDYALELGDGYEIHGTLYPNLLGRHITHGCIRLDDEDLAAVYEMAAPGTPVYVY
jgi:L,D-transpeptidase YbiS